MGLQGAAGVKYTISGVTYDSSDAASPCGAHSIVALSSISPFLLATNGMLTLQIGYTWPSIYVGKNVDFITIAEVTLAGSTSKVNVPVSFTTTIPCDCATLTLTSILDTSSLLTVINEYNAEIFYPQDILSTG